MKRGLVVEPRIWQTNIVNALKWRDLKDANSLSFNNITAKKDSAGGVTIHFGGDPKQSNYIPITKSGNYIARLYRPRAEILDGSWKFPEAQAVN
jgi:hypothetical protein